MPVFVIEDAEYARQSYATLNQGLGHDLRFGANDGTVIDRLRWLGDTVGASLEKAVHAHGPLDLKPFLAEGLPRGDELHNRKKATTANFIREFAPAIVRTSPEAAADVLEFISQNEHFCLNLSIAVSKCSADAAHAAAVGSIVTAMTSNGVEFGIRVSGLGDRWYRAPARHDQGRFFKGYGSDDAARNMGDCRSWRLLHGGGTGDRSFYRGPFV